MTSSSAVTHPASVQIEREPGSARLHLTVSEDFFFCRGHFAGQPIVPGAVVASWMLQAANHVRDCETVGGAFRNMKFRSPLVPGDKVTIAAEAGLSGIQVTVRSGERLCADALFLP